MNPICLALITSAALCLSTSCLLSQECDYTQAKFSYREEKNIFIGVDKDFQNRDDSLFIDIYFPVGDDRINRPIVIWAFGGGLFTGNRESMASFCQEMAKRGFVAATVDYRIGFTAGSGVLPPFTYDAAEIIRAGYRGMQDIKAAIRYMKGRSALDSTDIDRVWVGGISAGAIVSLAAAFIDRDVEKPKEAGNIRPIGNLQRDDLGPIEGTRFLNGHNSKVQGVFNFFGALLDTAQIQADNNVALFSYHQTLDPIVPCEARTPYWQLLFISSNYPIAYGSCVIERRTRNLGIPESIAKAWIYPGNGHETHNQQEVTQFMLTHANPILCGLVSANQSESFTPSDWYVYPNPASDMLHVHSDRKWLNAEIFSVDGARIGKYEDLEHAIPISHYNAGMYLIKLRDEAGNISVKKWLKK